MIIVNQLLRLYRSIYMRIQYFLPWDIFYINLVILLTFLSLMVTSFDVMNLVLLVGSCFNALVCVDVMSRHAVRCSSNKRERTSMDGVPRILQQIVLKSIVSKEFSGFLSYRLWSTVRWQ